MTQRQSQGARETDQIGAGAAGLPQSTRKLRLTTKGAPMEPTRVLVVANKTAATPQLIDCVRERAAKGQCEFTLLIPNTTHGLHKVVDPEDQSQNEAEAVIELALPLLEEAAGKPVDAMIGVPEPLA